MVLPSVGDVPLANKIQVTADVDDPTIAIIRGEVGAVFPNAFVVVQNLYTHDREITNTSNNGDFIVSLYGRNQTPYWVSAFQRFPSDDDINNAIGTTVYGEGADNTFYIESDLGRHYRILGDYTSTQINADDEWMLNLAIEMDIDDSLGLDGLRFSGEIYLLPVSNSPIQRHDYQWGVTTTPESVPVLGVLSEPIFLADVSTSSLESTEKTIQFDLNFDTAIPELMLLGRYQLMFMGYVQAGDSEREPWNNSTLLGTQSDNVHDNKMSLPLWLSNQTEASTELVWTILPDYQLQTDLGYISTPIYTNTLTILPRDSYSLEPFWIDTVDLPIEDGQMTVNVLQPDGTHNEFDADITQIERRLNSDITTLATDLNMLGEYPFTDYGDYEIQILGRLRVGEQSYFYGKDAEPYQIRIAEPIQVSPMLLAGTPLDVGDTIPIGLHLTPQLPADITVNISFSALDGSVFQLTQQGQADERGYYIGESILIEMAGHYQIDYQANYTDTEDTLWSGDLFTMGVIANPESDLIAHGERGVAGYKGVGQAWFDTSIYPNDDVTATQQPYYPYFSGDVATIPDASDSGIYPRLTMQTDSDLSTITITRPDVILRQFIASGDDSSVAFNGDDTFNQQMGAGIDGIRAGDYAFLFGGIVTHDDSAIYGALMVVEDEDNPARVLSPFMDKLNVFGQEVDMFSVPTGVRPAQVITLGEMLSIVGQVAPTLPADVAVSVTSPSGQWIQFADVANAIGYFYSPENDLELNEIGIWQIDIETTYRGETSLGQLERPYPEGHLSYVVYVVPPDNPPLGEAEFMTETRPITKTYALMIPDGWTEVRAFASITTPSAILVQDELTVYPAGTSYTYNPTTLVREFPNIELLETADGNHVADVLTLTLAMTGTDADGKPAIRTRTYSITHDVTYSADGGILR
jgi:hypothetical protein